MIRMLSDEMEAVLTGCIAEVAPHGKRLLETGTGYGHSAKFFSDLLPHWKIYTVDAFGLYGDGRIYKEWAHSEVVKVQLELIKCRNVIQILGDSASIPWELPLDILYLDADHTYEGVKADYNNYAPHVRPGGFIIFDDYLQPGNPTNGVKKFVDSLDLPIIYKSDRFVILCNTTPKLLTI